MKPLTKRRQDYVFGNTLQVTPVTRNQICGVETRLVEIEQIVDRMKNFRMLQKAGVDIGGGALLYGPAGVGKTYFARYIATTTKEYARFVDMRSFPRRKSDAEEALTPEDVRKLFALTEAFVKEKRKPIILLYDEFQDAGEDIIAELRVQLCGIRRRENGIYLLLLSTEELENSDEQLFRPGRVSDHIVFAPPSLRGKTEILAYHVGHRPHDPTIDFESIAFLFENEATPAFIAKLVEDAHSEACIEAGKMNAIIEERHLLHHAILALTGPAVEEYLNEAGRYMAAIHESGHAIFAHFLKIPIRIITILPQIRSSLHGGVGTVPPPEMLMSVETIEKLLVFRLGGMTAEKIFGFSNLLTSENDLADIMNCVSTMVERLGCGQETRRQYGCFVASREKSEYSDTLRRRLESDTARILKRAEKKAEELVRYIGKRKMKKYIQTVTEMLLKKNIILRKEFQQIFET